MLCFLRTDYEEMCTFGERPWPKPEILAAAWLSIAIYAIGVPVMYATMLFKWHMTLDDALNFLTKV